MSVASPARGDARQKRPVLRLLQVERHYHDASGTLSVLSGADFDMYPGELVALVAPSGAGKSTLLHIAGLLERPDRGDVEIAGRGTGRLSDRDRTAIRRVQIGFVYQFHHLLPEFTALENVVMPQLIRGLDRRLAGQRALQLLAYMRVKERAQHRPAELSGGEQQRVAIARAVANGPRVLLADEPTGNLDRHNAAEVLGLMRTINREQGATVVLVTHDEESAARVADRVVRLRDGRLVDGGGPRT
jgi:lipoprotein-releasing system ATP-binding protein